MYYVKWIIKLFVDEQRTKLLFARAYPSVKELCHDFKGISKHFIYDLERNKKKGRLNKKGRKSKYLKGKYENFEIWKIKKDKFENKTIQCFTI